MIMLHMKKVMVCMLFLLAVFSLYSEDASWSREINELYQSSAYTKFIDAVYNALPVMEIEQRFRDFTVSLDSGEYSREIAALVKAQASMLLGKHFTVEEYCMDKSTALQYLQLSEKLLENVSFSNTYLSALSSSVRAETAGSFFLLDPPAYIFSYGLSASRLIDEALSLDPINTQALLLLVNKYLHTPVFFGGSVRRGKETLDLLTAAESSMFTFQLFTLYELRGLVAVREKKTDIALNWYNKALYLFPGNNYIQKLIAEIN